MAGLLAVIQFFFSVPVLLSILAALTVSLYYRYKNIYRYWSLKGVKSPPPLPLLGNYLGLLASDRMKVLTEWRENYGKIYGIYQGVKPRLMVADPEIVNQICIKDFDIFPNHNLQDFANRYQREFIFFLQNDRWRRVRAMLSPTFTSGKIKRMFRLLDTCANDLILCFKEQLPSKADRDGQKSAVVDLKSLYHLYTMDGIATCCYGLKLDRANTADTEKSAARNDFIRVAHKFFQSSIYRMILLIALPPWLRKFLRLSIFPERQMKPLANKTEQLIAARRSSGKKFDDYFQLLLDAKMDDSMELNELDQHENHHAGLSHQTLIDDQKKMLEKISSSKSMKMMLSDIEILSNAMFLLSVGLETTGTLLTAVSYCLAFHQDIQQRLYQEMMKICELDEEKGNYTFSYDAITSSKYLDAVLSETLRLIPPIVQMDRKLERDYTIEKYNISLPKDSVVNLVYYSLHTDPDFWDEPLKFNPDRFMPENREKIVSGSYCPFGLGPRHCIGMRFSLTESKLAVAKLITNFRFFPAPKTSFPPKPTTTLGINTIKVPKVRIVLRDG